jgi:hypothetical protein
MNSLVFGLDRGKRSDLSTGRIIPEMTASYLWKVSWMGPRINLDIVEKRYISLPCREFNPGSLGRSSHTAIPVQALEAYKVVRC